MPDLQPGKVRRRRRALAEPSYTVFHYPTPEDKSPDPLLGERNWKVVGPRKGNPSKAASTRSSSRPNSASPYFLKLRKIYTLAPEGLPRRACGSRSSELPGGEKGKGQMRLQISGPRGLPIEGEWYTSTYRVAIIGWLDKKGTPRRQYEDAATIGNKRGGDARARAARTQFKYMVVATQYFASGVAIDDRADNTSRRALEEPVGVRPRDDRTPVRREARPEHAVLRRHHRAGRVRDDRPRAGEKVAHSYLLYNGPSKVRLL